LERRVSEYSRNMLYQNTMFATSPSVPKCCGLHNETAVFKGSRGHKSPGSSVVYKSAQIVLKPSSALSGKAQSHGDTSLEQAEVASATVLDRRFLLCKAVLVSLLGVTYPYSASAAGLGRNTKELAKAYVDCHDGRCTNRTEYVRYRVRSHDTK